MRSQFKILFTLAKKEVNAVPELQLAAKEGVEMEPFRRRKNWIDKVLHIGRILGDLKLPELSTGPFTSCLYFVH